MKRTHNLKLAFLFPEIAYDIIQKLKYEERMDLLDQVPELNIISLCGCEDPSCGSFYTVEPSITENESLSHEGYVTKSGLMEVFDGQIGFFEIMPSERGREVRSKINEAFRRIAEQ
ncbi:hypothetical protein [Paenibacillus dauci]|uniref:hypothetical protein n=1 Tax=Paenibacillus dauci TaxID=1567106 RepID=UPI0006198DE9|nr:hypothetical protein [Paenibacillus dauci]